MADIRPRPAGSPADCAHQVHTALEEITEDIAKHADSHAPGPVSLDCCPDVILGYGRAGVALENLGELLGLDLPGCMRMAREPGGQGD